MKTKLYEQLQYPDPSFAMIYHEDVIMTRDMNMHWHDSIEILYYVEGSGHTKCDNHDVESEAGDVIVVNTNQLHTAIPETDAVRYHCFILSQDLFHKGDINIYNTRFQNRVAKDAYLIGLFDSIVEEFKTKAPGYKLNIKGKLFIIFTHLIRYYQEVSPTSDKQTDKIIKIVKKAILYMEHQYQQPMTLMDICNHVNLSKYYFCRVFKDTVGRSPVEYLNLIRVNYAAELLSKGTHNVSEAAECCGFNSINYFSKVFKRYKLVSPSSIKDHDNA